MVGRPKGSKDDPSREYVTMKIDKRIREWIVEQKKYGETINEYLVRALKIPHTFLKKENTNGRESTRRRPDNGLSGVQKKNRDESKSTKRNAAKLNAFQVEDGSPNRGTDGLSNSGECSSHDAAGNGKVSGNLRSETTLNDIFK